MPWKEMSAMDRKTQFIADYWRETLARPSVVRYMFGLRTAYKRIDRYLRLGAGAPEAERELVDLTARHHAATLVRGGSGLERAMRGEHHCPKHLEVKPAATEGVYLTKAAVGSNASIAARSLAQRGTHVLSVTSTSILNVTAIGSSPTAAAARSWVSHSLPPAFS